MIPMEIKKIRSAEVRPDALDHDLKLRNMARYTGLEVEEKRRLQRP